MLRELIELLVPEKYSPYSESDFIIDQLRKQKQQLDEEYNTEPIKKAVSEKLPNGNTIFYV